MSRISLIARHHFAQEARKRSFLILIFSLPLLIAFMAGLVFVMNRLTADEPSRVGVVDLAGLALLPSGEETAGTVTLLAFPDEAAARAALDAQQIAGYYVVTADYRGTGRVVQTAAEPLPASAQTALVERLQHAVIAANPQIAPDTAARALSGPTITVQATDYNRTFDVDAPTAGQILPVVAALMFAFLVLTTGGYLMEVIVEEKESRTMELLITAVSPGQMMAGKILGGIAIGLLQLTVWIVCLIAAVVLGGRWLGIAWFQNVAPDGRDLLLLIAVSLPTYVLMGALMTIVGATLVERQEAQQIGGLFFLPLIAPIYLIVPLATNPDGPLAVGLSIFPVTSVMTLGLRMVIHVVPAWQAGLAAALAAATAVGAVWLAGRALRRSLLRYGQRMRLIELLRGDASAAGARPLTAAGEA